MLETEYMKSCTEVLEILKHISREDYNKIPVDIINVLENDKDEKYVFKYDVNKTLDEQNVSKQAKIIIALFFRDYWATDKQKEKIIAVQNHERHRIQEEKARLYNTDKLFKGKNDDKKENVAVVEIKRQKWYEKIYLILKKILKIK